jgi:transposase
MTTAQTAQGSTAAQGLYMALARGWKDWTVGCTIGLGQAPRQVLLRARELPELLAQIAHAKRWFGLPAEAPVHSVYEAGRDGVWLHRFLQTHAGQNVVVDAASIEVNWCSRRSKTDKLDVQKLLTMLVRFVLGETRWWKVVHVPSMEDEGLRQPHRELLALKLVQEVFGWREMRHRRELAALAGLTPTPYHSGQSQRAQEIRKAGNKRLRWLMVELAWGWLHWQPESTLSRWYQVRCGHGSARLRTLGIVALARQLLIALWRLVA